MDFRHQMLVRTADCSRPRKVARMHLRRHVNKLGDSGSRWEEVQLKNRRWLAPWTAPQEGGIWLNWEIWVAAPHPLASLEIIPPAYYHEQQNLL